jgi:alpha-galactosidase
MLFPLDPTATALFIDTTSEPARLPVIRWIGMGDAAGDASTQSWLGLLGPKSGPSPGLYEPHRGTPALIEQSRGAYTRPGLRGHRPNGTAWTTAFHPIGDPVVHHPKLTMEDQDRQAELHLLTQVEALTGGGIRGRHTLTNTGDSPYLLEGLEFSIPLPDDAMELLDFTGRHERERTPQRHTLADGLWLREMRRGKTGLDSATALIAGSPGFGLGHGEVLALSVATSGNSVLAAQRGPETSPILSGGELLLPGEIVLSPGESSSTTTKRT